MPSVWQLNVLKSTANSRVLILLTDGANTAGEISPLKAAELRQQPIENI